jgi:hypothetical protein
VNKIQKGKSMGTANEEYKIVQHCTKLCKEYYGRVMSQNNAKQTCILNQF